MRTTIFALIIVGGIYGQAVAQESSKAVQKLGLHPVYVLDSIEIAGGDMMKVDPSEIALANMFYEQEAIQLLGEKAKDGIAYFETKKFARHRFINFFRSYSPAFDSLLAAHGNDNSFQYILNDRVLSTNYEGELALIDNQLIKELKIVNRKHLKSNYKIKDKAVGVVIQSRVADSH